MRKALIATVLVLGMFSHMARSDCSGTPNMKPIIDNEPQVVATSTNGIRMSVEGSPYHILHVYGSAYQMGYAQGTLMKEDITNLFADFDDWAASQAATFVAKYAKWIPTSWVEAAVKALIPTLLDFQYWLDKDHIPSYYISEMQGLADATGIPMETFRRISLLPELLRMACSMMGAWGKGTEQYGGHMVQLRALDWATNGPFQKYATLIVYHPQQGNTFAVWSWSGFVGAVDGWSAAPLGMCEKLGTVTNILPIRGIPTTYLIRDILLWDNTREEAIGRIYNSIRTTEVFLGIGDVNGFNVVSYEPKSPTVYDWSNFTEDAHPIYEDVLYLAKHISGNSCYSPQIKKYYGNLTPENILRYITPMEQTGPMHIAIYDYGYMHMYLSSASPVSANGTFTPAYDNQFIKVDMAKMFSLPQPSSEDVSIEL